MLCETERICCRDIKEEDFYDIHSYASNIEVIKYMIWGPNSEDETEDFMEEAMKCITDRPRLKYDLVIIDKKLKKLVGGVAINVVSQSNRTGEIGYCINPKFWRNGYATEATKAIIEFGFKTLKLHRIQATCDVRNTGSTKVLQKCGLKREGIIREHILLRDGWRNSYLYSILED